MKPIRCPSGFQPTSMADSWRLQAEAAIRQGQSITDFVAHTYPSNRRMAKAAYDLASSHGTRRQLRALNAMPNGHD